MRFLTWVASVLVLSLGIVGAATAQEARGVLKLSASPPAKLILSESPPARLILSASKPAKLMRVDDGVFSLSYTDTIDLTDRKLLLGFMQISERDAKRYFPQGEFYIRLNGDRERVAVGTRIDLKRYRTTAGFVEDREVCFLDVVDFVAPKGAPPEATFRVSCQY